MPVSFGLMFRVEEPFEVRIKFREKDLDAVASDISEGGIGLLTDYDVPAGTAVNLKFAIYNDTALTESDGYRAFELRGVVRYMAPTREVSRRVGIEFVKIGEEDRQFIAAYIFTNKLKPSSE